jgi:DNA-binding CsgD family transcriptional regulator
MLETPVLELINLIYAAAFDAALWPRALVRLADLTRSESPVLMLFQPTLRQMSGFAPRTDPEAVRAYGEHWNHRNPLEQATRSRPVFEIASPETVMGAREFAKTPIFNEWWQPSGLGTAALETNLLFDGDFPTILNINRKDGADDYGSEDVAIFSLAARHIARAIEVGRAVSGATLGAEMLAAALEERGESVLLVDHQARILFATRAARLLLEAGDVLCLAGGAVAVAGCPGVLERLVASCQLLDSVRGGGSVAVERTGRSPLRLTVAPFRAPVLDTDERWFGTAQPAAVVTVLDPEAAEQSRAAAWRARFGLTPAEARFALEIVRGGGRRAAARRFGISDSTARTHLSNIFAKTGTARQAEMVARLLGAAAEMPVDENS